MPENKAPSFLDTLNDELGGAGEAVLGIPDMVKNVIMRPPSTTSEKATAVLGGPLGVPVKRALIDPAVNALDWYHEAIQGKHGDAPAVQSQVLSAAPNALGQAGMNVIMGKMAGGPAGIETPPTINPSNAALALAEHLKTGGSTVNPRTGQSLSGSRNWTVGVSPESARFSERPFTPDEYNAFTSQHQATLDAHPNSSIGTSFDPRTGLHTMELVANTPSKSAALKLGHSLGEDSIFNLENMRSEKTGATSRDLNPLTLDERMNQLRSDSPTREPYSGVHYSKTKLAAIDGARRGASGLGAEAARVRLGSQTGLGPDAPPGYHAYDSGGLPDSQFANSIAHPVSGHYAFATTEHPAFTDAYHQAAASASDLGADNATAHGIGLNAGEQALRDAGYDGYYNPRNPSSKFIFGGHDLAPAQMPATSARPGSSTPDFGAARPAWDKPSAMAPWEHVKGGEPGKALTELKVEPRPWPPKDMELPPESSEPPVYKIHDFVERKK